jgi:hypothetical protein
MKNVFFAFTPYHILLSCSIALDNSQTSENFLFIISDFSDAEVLGKILKNWQDSPFKKIIFLPGIYKKNIFKKRFIIRKNIKTLENLLQDSVLDKVYVPNDARSETQIILRYAKKNNKNALGIYIEDGIGAYTSGHLKKKNYLKLLLSKIFYGIWYKDITTLGTSQWIDQVMAIFPQFIRPELKTKKITPIKKDKFLKVLKEKVFFEYITSLIDIYKLKEVDILIIAAHSDLGKQSFRYEKALKEILNSIKTTKLKVAIKYHPREFREDFLSIANEKETIILPKSVPVELFYNFMPELKFIIGDISTPLLTGRWLLEKPEVISIARLLNFSDRYLFSVFKELNIKLVNNVEEIKNIILKYKNEKTNFCF